MNIYLLSKIDPILKYCLASKATAKCQKYVNFQTLAYFSVGSSDVVENRSNELVGERLSGKRRDDDDAAV
uniref:Uncharacterized protein n=1 Tax=Romanomermis culicivorax TaxID=13658 RepID=A0A915JZM6_ROMCU